MRLKFKKQKFQIDAAQAVVDCFVGQPNQVSRYTLDKGKREKYVQPELYTETKQVSNDIGFKNKDIMLHDNEVLENIRMIQQKHGIKQSESLDGHYNLTIEMETGTGKTYTYIKTMFELCQNYGWSKFIIVTPSIAIREGVNKSFEVMEDHFMQEYQKKIKYFIYNSKNLTNIESFASDSGINVMIINSQAFAARGKDARRIYMELDEFQTRKPIDVIAKTRPILIIDEPQSVEGTKTKEALKEFDPLFTLRYSATHRHDYNKIYRLDALDAYNLKLVKKINVKGITVKGSSGTEGYLYLEGIDLSTKKGPIARLEYQEKTKSGLKKVTRKLQVNADLYELSGNLEQYKEYKLSEINGQTNIITFMNGATLSAGEVQGDITELNFRRIQIRETIKSHFEKERNLFDKGIKVLSLFFIDEVAKYRQYDKNGSELGGEYARIFEEEYLNVLNQYLSLFEDDGYVNYLKNIQTKDTHKGYFSIDKKSNRFIESKVSAKETESNDVDAYELIMRDKEKLLSLEEPTRFIFSHSALKEGWDNPNVFQICTLKHSDSTVRKRQEVGRGLRLCVNQEGERMDSNVPGIDAHDINILTVVASESYETFAKQLQGEIADTLSDRPQKADVNFFLDKIIENERGEVIKIEESLAKKLYKVFLKNDYLDEDDDSLTQDYFEALKDNRVILPDELENHRGAVLDLIKTIYTEGKTSLVDDDRKNNAKDLQPNSNFAKKEFKELWSRINQKTVYTVSFDTDELVEKCIVSLDMHLTVPDVQFTVKRGEMKRIESKEQLNKGEAFVILESQIESLSSVSMSQIRYDLIGKLIDETRLTRKTFVKILSGVKPATFLLFRKNPEEFIIRTAKLINEQKATTIIERITYDVINESFDTNIFTRNNLNARVEQNELPFNKHIYDFVVSDSNTEKAFARDLDISKEVCVFAKLPRGFYIPTPVGQYNPDWAIVFNESSIKYIYFIAETKGCMESLELRGIEEAKIHCARKHFEKLNTENFKYDVVSSYEKLLEIVR